MNVASGTAGELLLFTDEIDGGAPLGVVPNVFTNATPGWDSVIVGLPHTSGMAPANVLIDDVVISLYDDSLPVRHIGCSDPPVSPP